MTIASIEKRMGRKKADAIRRLEACERTIRTAGEKLGRAWGVLERALAARAELLDELDSEREELVSELEELAAELEDKAREDDARTALALATELGEGLAELTEDFEADPPDVRFPDVDSAAIETIRGWPESR